ncbi:UNVERIFIED_CONTAM: hypothetical protein GTU68_040462, partial [Idotea baltica]|nr:hypothetical protein [Idotea baltica]
VVHLNIPSLEVQDQSHEELAPGGHFRPSDCQSRHKVALIVPFRDRERHMEIFLYNLIPFLEKQQIEFNIFIVEQAGNRIFNRGMLKNIGSIEALKLYPYNCFIFHDIDLIPEDDRNLYTCPEQPRHMSVAIDKFDYKLPYKSLIGGVCAMTVEQFQKVNGFSNKFWGWGAEDDDMANRIKFHGYVITRYPTDVARYKMLLHKKDEPNPRRSESLSMNLFCHYCYFFSLPYMMFFLLLYLTHYLYLSQ